MNDRILFGFIPLSIMALFLVGIILHATNMKKTQWNEDLFGIVSTMIIYTLIIFGPHALLRNDLALGLLIFLGFPLVVGIYVVMGLLFKLFQKVSPTFKALAVAMYIILLIGFYNLWWLT